MTDRLPLVYKKAKGSKVVTVIATALSVLFGIFMFVVVPLVPYNYVFLLISFAFPILSIIDNHQLLIVDGKVKYSALYMRWEVELNEIEEWKILGETGGIGSHPLIIRTKSGKRVSVPSLTALGIRNPDEFAGDFAKCIRSAKKDSTS